MNSLTTDGLVLLVVGCVALLIAGLTISLANLGLEPAARRKILLGADFGISAWLLFTYYLAESGALGAWNAIPPRLPLLPLTTIICLVLINRTQMFRKILEAVPTHWPVALQTFRIGVEAALWGLYVHGGAPAQVTFEGRNFDMLVGLTAPLLAIAIIKNAVSPKNVLAWNFLSFAVLINTIATTATSVPGPLHLNWPGEPFTALASWPVVWIPAFLAPLAVFLHVFSIRQNVLLLKLYTTKNKTTFPERKIS